MVWRALLLARVSGEFFRRKILVLPQIDPVRGD